MRPTPVWIPIALGLCVLACEIPAVLRRRRARLKRQEQRRRYQRQRQALERAWRRVEAQTATRAEYVLVLEDLWSTDA